MGKKKKQEKQKEKKKKLTAEEKKLQKAKKAKKEPAPDAKETVPGLTSREAMLIFRALGDETRMQIFSLLEKEELCGTELLERVRVVQSTLSHHMKILTESGIVKCRKEIKRVYYSISSEQMKRAAAYLELMINSKQHRDDERPHCGGNNE